VIIYRSLLLKITNVSEKVVEKIKSMFNHFFFENPAVYEIMWKNILEPDRAQMTV
jgi:hypothetical protein